MKRGLAAALLLLCLSHIHVISAEKAKKNATSSGKAGLKQYGDGYDGPSAYDAGPGSGPYEGGPDADPEYTEQHECPVEQPADQVKEGEQQQHVLLYYYWVQHSLLYACLNHNLWDRHHHKHILPLFLLLATLLCL